MCISPLFSPDVECSLCRCCLRQSEWEGFRGPVAKMPRLHHKKRVCGVVTGGVKLDSGYDPPRPTQTRFGVGRTASSHLSVVHLGLPARLQQYLYHLYSTCPASSFICASCDRSQCAWSCASLSHLSFASYCPRLPFLCDYSQK